MKKIISARSLVFELNNSRWFSFRLSFIFVFLAYNTLALGANCEASFPEKIEKCKSLSVKVKSNCEFVAQEKIDQKALVLLNNSSSTYPIEAGRGLLVLTGSKNTNYKIDLTAEIKQCENTIGEYKQDCSGIVDELNTCMASASVVSENDDESKAEDLTSSISEAEENLAFSQRKLSLSEEKIEKLDTEIKKNIVNLCKQDHSGSELKSGCNEPSAEFISNALQSFSSCSPSDERYDSNKCIAAVMPSVDLNANGSNAAAKATSTSDISAQPNQRSIASTEVTQLSVNDPVNAPAPTPASVRTEPISLAETTHDSAKSSKNSDFKLPSFGTIAKYTLLATLAYGAVTGKLKKWINKIVTAINPLANDSSANRGASNTNLGKSSTLAAKISGVVNPPSQAERIAMRNRNRANGDGDGGGLDGGIYMQGAFELKTDANGVVTSSNIIIHGTSNFTAVGRVTNDGSKSILNLKQDGIHDVGTLELIVKNNSVYGKMHHGGGKEWIYGDAVGSYSP